MRHRGSVIAIIAVTLFATGANPATAAETIIYSFGGSPDGSVPYPGLISDAAGNLYGTTSSGGTVGSPFDIYGTVFELTPEAGGGWKEKVVYSFGSPSGDGIQPLAGLIFDAHGNLYGTTSLGGAHGDGTVFELERAASGAWTEKVLYSFGATSTDASQPKRGSLIFDAKGNLYGTTRFGGPYEVSNGGGVNSGGTVFELMPGADGSWTEKVLYSFGVTSKDGANPVAGVIFDAVGDLYGTTLYGGVYNDGTVFELTPAADGKWTEKLLHSFDINGTDGSLPIAGVIFDAQGNLYGTTEGGGSNPFYGGLGTVFELRAGAGGTWTEQVLHSFSGPPGDGDYPDGGLIFDAAGNLYGTTSSGGSDIEGTVFELAAGIWTEKVLYNFTIAQSDGQGPLCSLMFDAAGNLYGTTSAGGMNSFGLAGTVFKLSSVITASPGFSPGAGAFTTAQSVKITDVTPGATIYYAIDGGASAKYTEPVAVAKSETIQAVALSTGLPQSEVATASYQIGDIAATPLFSPVAGAYTIPQLVTLTDAAPGATIYYTTNGTPPTTSSTKYTGPITVSATETIEAFAVATGYTNSPVASAKYTIIPLVAPQEKVLYSFGATSTDGNVPYGSLIFDAKGNLYGTTEYGGTHQTTYAGKTTYAGTVVELSPATGGGWTEKVLYNFGATSTDATHPLAGLIFDAKGNLYGTTYEGGAWGLGTVFELSPATGGGWTEKVLHSFGGTLKDGEIPAGGLVFDAKGNLYGTTQVGGAYDSTYGGGANGFGTVFELSPATGGTWTEQVLYSFSYLSQTDGYYPEAGLIFDAKGNLYGTTSNGGTGQDSQGGGTVFELSPVAGGWTEKVLCSFGGGGTEGYRPEGGLVFDDDGNLYGTAYAGGNGFGLDGTVFELSPEAGGGWTEKVLHSFGAYETDGINPNAGLVFDFAGNLYGTTYGGGGNGYGTVFELTPEADGGWTESVLHSFNLNGVDGASPYASLVLDVDGNLYGTTGYGGSHGASNSGTTGGTVFKLTSPTPAAPSVSLSAPTLTFAPQNDGTTSATQTETVTNAGTANLVISTVTKEGTDPVDFTVSANTCENATLSPQKTCTVSVKFTPSATGSLSASLSLADNAAHSPQAVSLEGTGLPAVAVTLSPASASVALGKTQLFTATISNATNTALEWYVNGVLNGNTTQGTLTGTGLTRTYTAPAVNVPSPNPAVIKVASVEDPSKFKTASVTVTDTIAVTLSPASASVALGKTQLFTATISNTTNTALDWYVNGVLNGNTTQGTLTGTGLTRTYTAPAVNVPSPNPAVIKVASVADPSKFKTASVTVTDTIAVTLSPASASVALGKTQLFTATISNTTNTALDWYVNGVLNGNTTQGTLTGTGLTRTYTAPAVNVPSPNPAVIKVASVADPSKFKTASVTVTDTIAVTLSPASASVALGKTQLFTATISNTTNTALDWYVNGVLNGNTTQGTLTGAGLTRTYTAPAVDIPSPNPAVIKMASVADPSKFKTASVTVTDTIAVTLSPASASVALGKTQLFTATISSTTNTALDWYVNGVLNGNTTQGTLTGTGLTRTYTAPAVDIPSPNPAVIKMASVADPSKFKTASVTVTDTIAVTLSPASASVALGKTQLFTATISSTTNTALDWYVNGVLNGNTTQGTLTGTGLTRTYTAPAVNVPSPNPAVVKMASVADPTRFKTASVTVTKP